MQLRKTLLTATLLSSGLFVALHNASALVTDASVLINPSPNSFVKEGDLIFGDVTPATTQPCNITMSPLGDLSVSLGSCLLGSSPLAGSASFTVTGLPDSTYSIVIPPDATLIGPGDPMLVSGFTHNSTGLLTAGTETFNLGGTLEIGASQQEGSYIGSFDVEVVFN